MNPTAIVGYITLFVAVAASVVLIALALGWLLRPHSPSEEKLATYECGEPTIGSSFVQFDLRFYVVALLFLIFDVEVAFFFPWATVFGKATQLTSPRLEATAVETKLAELGLEPPPAEAPGSTQTAGESAAADSAAAEGRAATDGDETREAARLLARTAMVDILVFFAVLMVGFAYIWYRGDLDWVRAVASSEGSGAPAPGDEVAPAPHASSVLAGGR